MFKKIEPFLWLADYSVTSGKSEIRSVFYIHFKGTWNKIRDFEFDENKKLNTHLIYSYIERMSKLNFMNWWEKVK